MTFVVGLVLGMVTGVVAGVFAAGLFVVLIQSAEAEPIAEDPRA